MTAEQITSQVCLTMTYGFCCSSLTAAGETHTQLFVIKSKHCVISSPNQTTTVDLTTAQRSKTAQTILELLSRDVEEATATRNCSVSHRSSKLPQTFN